MFFKSLGIFCAVFFFFILSICLSLCVFIHNKFLFCHANRKKVGTIKYTYYVLQSLSNGSIARFFALFRHNIKMTLLIFHFTSRIRTDRKEQQNSNDFTWRLICSCWSFYFLLEQDVLPKMDFMCSDSIEIVKRISFVVLLDLSDLTFASSLCCFFSDAIIKCSKVHRFCAINAFSCIRMNVIQNFQIMRTLWI